MDRLPQYDRRTAIKGIAATVGIGGTGLGALAISSEPASAEVTADLTLPDGAWRNETPPEEIWLQCSGDYSYNSPEVEPTDLRVTVGVGATADNQDTLAEWSTVPFGFDGSGTWSAQGDLTDTAIWTADDFKAGDGNAIAVEVHASITFAVLDGGSVIVEAEAADSGTVTVEDTTSLADASVSGTGSWAFVNKSGDPTPTPP